MKLKFFAVCDSCSSMEWVTDDSVDELTSDGESNSYLESQEEEGGEVILPHAVLCAECEKVLEPILFKDVNKRERKRIYRMEKEQRINYAKGLLILKQFDREKNEIL